MTAEASPVYSSNIIPGISLDSRIQLDTRWMDSVRQTLEFQDWLDGLADQRA